MLSTVAIAFALSACGGDQGVELTSSMPESTSATPTTLTPSPVVTTTPVATPTADPSPIATATPTPTATSTPEPTSAPSPTPTPTPTASAPPTSSAPALSGILSEGDSISVFWGGNHTGIYANSHPNMPFYGRAVGGSQLRNSGNDLVMRFDDDVALHPRYVTILIGANDIPQVTLGWGGYPTTESWSDALFSYVARWRATGAKVAVGTVLPQCFPTSALFMSNRAKINAAIRAAVGTKIDAVIDFAADPVMGSDTAACDASLYDGFLHPTAGCGYGCGGQGKLAVIYRDAVDRMIEMP